MDLHSFSKKNKVSGDPLLIDCDDKDTMDSFSSLLGSSDRSAFGDLDLDSVLDPHTDLGHWLQNNSMSQLTTTLDTDGDASLSEGHLLPVNPESVMPLQHHQHQQQQTAPQQGDGADSPNSAAVRLHANCSNMEAVKTVILHQQPQQHSQQQQTQTQHIQLVAMPVTVNSSTSGSSTPVHGSPMKASAIILDGTTFSVAGTFITSQPKLHTVAASDNQKSRNILTPSQCSPVLLGHLQSGISPAHRPITVTVASPLKHTNFVQHSIPNHSQPQQTVTAVRHHKLEDKVYPKPVFSYSCLIALALKNSKTGNLPVSEIYNFMCENFPYFKTAPDGWKNSVRHNLSLNKCFAKVDNPKLSSGAKKGCLWALNPAKVKKMEEEITKWGKKDPVTLLKSMAFPENLEAIEKGQAGLPFRKDSDSEDENVPSPMPSKPVKVEAPSTPHQQEDELVISEFEDDHMQQQEMEQEYMSHAMQWGLQDVDVDDIHIDLLTHSPLTSSPLPPHGSPLPHTPSRSGAFLTSSPVHLHPHLHAPSPSSVRANLFGATVTPTRTLSALN